MKCPQRVNDEMNKRIYNFSLGIQPIGFKKTSRLWQAPSVRRDQKRIATTAHAIRLKRTRVLIAMSIDESRQCENNKSTKIPSTFAKDSNGHAIIANDTQDMAYEK